MLFAVVFLLSSCSPQGAKIGDYVTFDYTLRFADDGLAETTSREVAADAGRIISGKDYGPVTAELGAHKTLKGFEEALVGMNVGETKTLVLPPEKAYGPYNDKLVGVIPSRKQFPVTIVIPQRMEFSHNESPGVEPGDIFRPPGSPFHWNASSVNDSVILARVVNLSLNDTVSTPGAVWTSRIVALSPDIVLEAMVPDGVKIQTGLGDLVVHRNSTDIETVLDKNIGDLIKMPSGFGRVIRVTHDEIFVDMNDPLANYTLGAELTVQKISSTKP